ncbi:hypothetical protein J6590_062415 [Homalodisca vitripennis]|nr:hypothetical protein J6590_062415 [Homalodisca vitripennis]
MQFKTQIDYVNTNSQSIAKQVFHTISGKSVEMTYEQLFRPTNSDTFLTLLTDKKLPESAYGKTYIRFLTTQS